MSIERLFDGIRSEFSKEWETRLSLSPFKSQALVPRLRNLRAVSKLCADIHHIVGDVHYLALGLPGDRTVLTIHDCAALERLSGWRREVLRQLWFVRPMMRAAVVTTISEATKDELRRWTGNLAEKTIVIPNCVRKEFQPNPRRFDSDCPVILQVGTGWNKNVLRVARALKGLSCRLEIVGELDDSQRNEINSTGISFRELGRITDEELANAYRECDMLVFASHYEGFGLPIIEAQAVGRPVVTSKVSSMPEVAGAGAILVDPEDEADLRLAIISICESPDKREALVREGFYNVEKFRSHQVAKRYEEVYRSLLV